MSATVSSASPTSNVSATMNSLMSNKYVYYGGIIVMIIVAFYVVRYVVEEVF